ncbi:MAG: hypothetical protein M2R45_03800 [Verrucomicrobia subdivision 3 bacterium]|nr:hypothetical protein [Limisphaerales bacterium]MCS1416759.1 hypothetical protein [Limisphaerales bacterium]
MQCLKIHTTLWLASLTLAAAVAANESEYYRIDTLPTEDLRMEVGAMMLRKDGRMMVGTRIGEIYIIENAYGDPEKATFKLWTRGIAQPLGLLEHDGWIYTAQRGELTRMKDIDGDDQCDIFENVCDEWEISGNYHEYNFGPRLGPKGCLWVTTNKPFGGEPYGQAHWRGWAVRIDPKTGKMFPMSAGLRSPAGVENSPWGDMFYTDNQGEWCNASKLSHLEFGDYHGHPHGLMTKDLAGPPFNEFPQPVSGTWMKDMHLQNPHFKMPAVWFPYDKMGKSPSGLKWDLTEGGFGPYAGQIFVADQHHASVMRVVLEQVDGHWQGACIPFREGFQCGIIRICFGKDDSLFVGQSNAGWGGRGNRPWGIQRLRWTGKTPFDIHTIQARPDGFKLTFTQAVDLITARDPANYTGESYTYKLESRYGGPEDDKKKLKITSVAIADDAKSVILTVDTLRAGYVHELKLKNLANQTGVPLLHQELFYTLVNIPKKLAL